MRIVHQSGLLTLVVLLTGCVNRSQHPAERHVQSEGTPLLAPFHKTVTIVSTNRFIFVGGEVKRPGRFIWTNELTLTHAIEMAGGLTQFANRSRLELRHSDGSLDLFSYAAVRRGLTNNPVLQPNDQLHVGKKFYLPPEAWSVVRSVL